MLTTERTKSLKHAVRAFPGTRFHFRLTGAETGGAISIIDVTMIPGSEPAPHLHTREDETAIIRHGAIRYFIGNEIVDAKVGDTVFLPRNVPHYFKVLSPSAAITLIATPGGLEQFFEAVTFPVEGDDVPPVSNAPLTAEKIALIQQNAEAFGLKLVQAI